jgi:hypothetical protein
LLRFGIDAGNPIEQHGYVFLFAQNSTYRPRDIGRRKAGGGDLVQQRLEEMVIVLVDQRDIDIGFSKATNGKQPADAGR